ncbi:MAG TPA: hypothetical protein VJ728_01045 [Candidatus Binataceae bacterium]|nr:hypothetical protein [Candidatus Binataceae bacterium]
MDREIRQPVGQAVPFGHNLHDSPRSLKIPMLLGLLGGAVLAGAAAAPLFHIPIVGSISYLHHPSDFNGGNLGEVVILATAGLSIIFAVLNRFKLLWLTGASALGQLVGTVVIFHRMAETVVSKADRPELVDPTLMWAGAVLEHAHYKWGIGMVAGGALLVLAAAAWELISSLKSRR